MVNRVILLGILDADPKYYTEGESKKHNGFFKIRVFRYNRNTIVIPGKCWGRSVSYFQKLELKKGDGLQIVGSLGTNKNNSGEYVLTLSIDSATQIPWMTKAWKEIKWEEK